MNPLIHDINNIHDSLIAENVLHDSSIDEDRLHRIPIAENRVAEKPTHIVEKSVPLIQIVRDEKFCVGRSRSTRQCRDDD